MRDVPVEEGPDGPKSREHDEFRRHGDFDHLELCLGRQLLGHKDACPVRSDHALERGDQECKRKSHTLDDEEGDVGVWCNTTVGAFDVVFGEADVVSVSGASVRRIAMLT